ncbi:unnamed protein product, partial [marine sediment metagenome]
MNEFFKQEIENFIEANGSIYEMYSQYIIHDSLSSFHVNIERNNEKLELTLNSLLLHKHSDMAKSILLKNYEVDVAKYTDCGDLIGQYINELDEIKLCEKCMYDVQHDNDLNYCKHCYLQSFFKCKYSHDCGICLEANNLDSFETICGHFFHSKCIKKIIQYSDNLERYTIICP